MSPNVKLSILALVGAAAAVPHNNNHARFHSGAGFVGPTGGWKLNSTRPAPTGTGTAVVGDKTTTIQETQFSTETVVSTIYATKSKSGLVGVADVSTDSAACGGTVYVTATEKVTVTVPAGASAFSASSSSVEILVSSSAPAYVVVSSSSAPAAAPTTATTSAEAASTSVVASVPVASAKTSVAATSAAPYSVISSVPVAASSVVASSPAVASSVVASSSAVASSATPSATPSSSPSYTGGKRGLAYRWDGASDAKSFAPVMKPGFAWNWESTTKGDIGSIPFIPTLRTLANAGDWLSNVDAAVKAGSSVVFGFNEPDSPDQAALSPSAACSAWKQYMNPIATKYPQVSIVGPSVTSNVAAGTGLDWLKQFKAQCPDAVYHTSNVHWYGYGTATFDDFKTHIDSAISQFGKVWVTEFAMVNCSVADSEAFLKKALAYLDSNTNVVGYSYFAVGSFDSSFNMLGTGTALTDVGKIYVS